MGAKTGDCFSWQRVKLFGLLYQGQNGMNFRSNISWSRKPCCTVLDVQSGRSCRRGAGVGYRRLRSVPLSGCDIAGLQHQQLSLVAPRERTRSLLSRFPPLALGSKYLDEFYQPHSLFVCCGFLFSLVVGLVQWQPCLQTIAVMFPTMLEMWSMLLGYWKTTRNVVWSLGLMVAAHTLHNMTSRPVTIQLNPIFKHGHLSVLSLCCHVLPRFPIVLYV